MASAQGGRVSSVRHTKMRNSSLGLQNHELGGNLRGDLVQSPPLGRRSPKAAEDQPATLG